MIIRIQDNTQSTTQIVIANVAIVEHLSENLDKPPIEDVANDRNGPSRDVFVAVRRNPSHSYVERSCFEDVLRCSVVVLSGI